MESEQMISLLHHRLIVGLVLFPFAARACCQSIGAGPAERTPAVAMAEMQTIAQTMDICSMDTLYYVVPEALNDTRFSDSLPNYDYINNENGTWAIRPEEGRFRTSKVNLMTGFNQWQGPYVTYQPGRTQTGISPYDQGAPLDPWGNPYYLFSPLGLLRGDLGLVTQELYGDQFDGYRLVSLGADGVRSADDVSYTFGPAVTTFGLSSIRGPRVTSSTVSFTTEWQAEPGSGITVRGVDLGSSQNGARVLFRGQELAQITRWSAREIDLTLPSDLQGTGTLTIERLPNATNGLTFTVRSPAAAGSLWLLVD